MSDHAIRSARRLRSEFFPLSIAFATSLILAAVFPYGALSPLAPSSGTAGVAEASCAFVSLTDDEMSKALAAARTSWHVNSDSLAGQRLEMFEELPEAVQGAVVDIDMGNAPRRGQPPGYKADAVPTDMRAPLPPALPSVPPSAPKPAFSREDLLKSGF